MTRHRDMPDPVTHGYLSHKHNGTGDEAYDAMVASARRVLISDENPGPGDFALQKDSHSTMNHSWDDGVYTHKYVDAVLLNDLNHLALDHHIPGFVWHVDTLATKAAARSNPSRPEVSVPQFVGELKDLPRSIYLRGKDGIRWAKTDSIGIRFGILPFISDVLKLMKFQDKIVKRNNELDRLQSGKGLKRRIRLATAKDRVLLGGPNCFPDSGPNGFTAAKASEMEVWASVRWKPGYEPMTAPSGSDERNKFVKAVLLGTSKRNDIYSYARDAWELLPWSWMADWFSNVGEYLDANRNRNVAQVEEVWVMRQRSTAVVTKGILGKYVSLRETKERYLGNVSLTVTPAVLTPEQVSILGGLAVKNPRHKMPRRLR